MTISGAYLKMLDHFGTTRPVRSLLTDAPDVVALRHDVDHDLDLALEMAFWEHRREVQATYFLLPSAPYWADPLLDDKIRQLADYGHEIGLHLNALAEWVDGRSDAVLAHLQAALARLRAAGVEVIGSAAHGDRACYQYGVINNWVFTELRPDDPSTEDGLSAEGVPSPDERFRIPYAGDTVVRDDGAEFRLWSVSMASLGLDYEAVRLPMDAYYSDSGGSWTRSPDPTTRDLSTGRHQVLIHPEYYRGPQKSVFVLSTARSGSTWMSRALQVASSADASHEHTLNHLRGADGAEVPDHRTGAGFTALLDDDEEVHRRILQVRGVREEAGRDHVECNVYLPHFLTQLRTDYPDADFIHLHRDPFKVLRSILNRNWYDTPYDDRHAPIDVDGWDGMSQLERCCSYITAVMIDLALASDRSVSLEEVLADPTILIELFAASGIAVHRRLLAPLSDQVVNANRAEHVPPVEDWPEADRRTATLLLGQATRLSGRRASASVEQQRSAVDLLEGIGPTWSGDGGEITSDGAVEARLEADGVRHAYLLFGGGRWQRCRPRLAWQVRAAGHAEVEFEISGADDRPVNLFALTYGEDRRLLAKRHLQPLADGTVHAAFRPRSDGTWWNLAVHAPRGEPASITIRDLQLRWMT